jgi:hypothetical protein
MSDIFDLLGALRYQVLTPRVSTWGTCSEPLCLKGARGAAVCQWCLMKKLSELTEEPALVVSYGEALLNARDALHALEEAYDNLIELEKRDE